tara:strand:- start:757 stop:1008 length:252 start_codon:yes stop_codon:yes gene_type:complete
MPKYYVKDGAEQTVLIAKSPIDACCVAVLTRFNTFVVNGFYIVSEIGLEEEHAEDIIFGSNDVLDVISKNFPNNPEKDDDLLK